MKQEDLAYSWLKLSISGAFDYKDPFLRFIAAWLAFNSLYAETFYTIDGDRRQVMAFSEDERGRIAHGRLLADNPEYKSAIGILAEQGVRDVRSGRRREIVSAEELADILSCVYQVRCNLIHGGKHLHDERDRNLAHAGYIVVANLVSVYFTGIAVPEATEPRSE
jgi:hypothetical protein